MTVGPEAQPSPPVAPGAAPPGRAWPWLLPVVLSVLVMAAHFVRFMVVWLALVTLLLPLLLFFRRTWAVRVVQLWLLLGTVMWAFTTRRMALERQLRHEPFLRLALIMATVTAVSLVAVLAFESRPLRALLRRRRTPMPPGPAPAAPPRPPEAGSRRPFLGLFLVAAAASGLAWRIGRPEAASEPQPPPAAVVQARAAPPAPRPALELDGKVVAVLDLRSPVRGLNKAGARLADQLRGLVSRRAPGARVVARETIAERLGKEPAACEGSCELEAARALGADLLVAGDLQPTGPSMGPPFAVSLRLHDARTGQPIGRSSRSAGNVRDLEATLQGLVAELLPAER